MADFSELIQIIDEQITANGQGLITGPILNNILDAMLQAVGLVLDQKVTAEEGKSLILNTLITKLENLPNNDSLTTALNNKVDKVTGKSLILDTLITKLSNMPTITGFNATTNHIFIDGKEYELTPYIPIPDYYIGFCDNNTTFSNYSDAQLISNAQYNGIISTTPDYPSASGYVYFGAGQKCMYLLYNVNANLRVDIDNPAGTAFDLEDQTPEQIDMFNHANVVSNGKTYRVVATYDVNNSQENGFRFKFN